MRRLRRPQHEARRKLQVGIDIPTPAEIKSIVHAATGRWRPPILTAVFTGLRSSELRGLTWTNIDLDEHLLHVRQRVDRYGPIGSPKSEAGTRSIPLPPIVVNTLREWRLACPKGDLNLVFPNASGGPMSHQDLINRGLIPVLVAVGLAAPLIDEQGEPGLSKRGEPLIRGRYTGLHSLRHWYASWCINRRTDGGLELPPKVVQERLGHSTIGMLMDTYGHLFPATDDEEVLTSGERALLA
jgi:integrase